MVDPSLLDGLEGVAVERAGAMYLLLGRPPYPALLAEIETAPPVLIVAGDPGLLARPAVAIVGARNASAAAIRFARMLAHDLAAERQVALAAKKGTAKRAQWVSVGDWLR